MSMYPLQRHEYWRNNAYDNELEGQENNPRVEKYITIIINYVNIPLKTPMI
jgi:hypothetical protein